MEIDMERLSKAHDVTKEYLTETFVILMKGLENKLLKEFKDLNSAELIHCMLSFVVGVSGTVIGNICLCNKHLDAEEMCGYVHSMILESINEATKRKVKH